MNICYAGLVERISLGELYCFYLVRYYPTALQTIAGFIQPWQQNIVCQSYEDNAITDQLYSILGQIIQGIFILQRNSEQLSTRSSEL